MSFTGAPPPERLNLARYCLADKAAEKTALIVAGEETRRWSYGALEDLVLRMAAGLCKLGLEPGQRLFIRMGNSLDYALVFLAANAAGAIPIAASPMLTPTEVAALLRFSGARFIAWDGLLALPALEDITLLAPDDIARLKTAAPGGYADTASDDPGYMIFTSGTSGTPKGVLHAQRAIWGRRPMYRGWYGIGPSDVMLHTGAFNWTYTLGTGLFDPFANGCTSVVYTGTKDDAVWERLIAEHGVTIMASVPGIYRHLLRAGFRPAPTLRHGLTAGEALARPILDGWREQTGTELYEALGMSEISTYISSSPTVPVRPGSPGKPQEGRAVRVLEDGELAVHRSDPGLFLGYWGEERFAEEWFATGDTAEFDADGYVWCHGRIDDMMNAGGFRVSPLEVEKVLLQHGAIAEAGVREWRVSETASIIAAFLVPREGADVNEEAVMGFVRERLAAYKCPKQIWFVPALPRTANGKLNRKALEKP
ncbi:AMP-dependent synthetase [Aestuariivirga litoralis]|uniref:AMP-dependent synthetase n=1 Tax=Aestuariivirga litoralis TaxID=2650924 RepID=A0A2W2B9K3_9HYPH|nr:acyl-CoA synthetase [Aestuariivirga litoralis]PZF76768.1 AMP-dependent synthetase [Aestuariivirga litoralis]